MGNPSSKHRSSTNDELVTVKKYIGEAKDGKRHGRGIYMYPNGDIYDGEWRKSKRYGYGVYTYSEGNRLEGYFYKDEYIGKTPNKKIQTRMDRKKIHTTDCGFTEQTDVSIDVVFDDQKDAAFKVKSEGSNTRRVESLRRNKWIRDKYNIRSKASTPLEAERKQENDQEEGSKNFKRSYSSGDKRKKGIDFDEAVERRRSQKLRESIRQKYNLKVRGNQDSLLNSE